jgi:DNA-binding response OmpR family regulator
MPFVGKCSFFRSPQNLAMGRGLGYCDLDGDQAICDGDVQFCKNREVLRKHLLEQKSNGGSNSKEESQSKKPYNYKVLVVDDEEAMRKMMITLLSRLGHQCITASNGIEALKIINQNKIDAVITDIVMPEMDGIVLTKETMLLYPNLPIMVMTGHGKQYSAESAVEAGARDFIEKPFSIDEFILRLNKMIRDSQILCQIEAKQNEIEAKQNEITLNLSRRSSEEIDGLEREIEGLKNRLCSVYSRSL